MELEENNEVNIHISPCCDSFTSFNPSTNGVEIKCNECHNVCYIIKNHNLVVKSFINTNNTLISGFLLESYRKLLKRSLFDKTLPYYSEKCKKCNSKQRYMLVDKTMEIVMCVNPKCETHR